MTEEKATNIAKAIDGESYHSGGNVWVVFLPGIKGRLVCISEDLICEYANLDAFYDGETISVIEIQESLNARRPNSVMAGILNK